MEHSEFEHMPPGVATPFSMPGYRNAEYDILENGLKEIGRHTDEFQIPYTPSQAESLFNGTRKLERELFGFTRTFLRSGVEMPLEQIAAALHKIGAITTPHDALHIAKATAGAKLNLENGNELSWRPIAQGSNTYKVVCSDPIGDYI